MSQYEFHIRRKARENYQIDDLLFSISGNLILADIDSARRLAHQINSTRNTEQAPARAIKAADLYAAGLLDEVMHRIVDFYRTNISATIIEDTLAYISENIGVETVDATLLRFVEEFPPVKVHRREIAASDYLDGVTDATPNRQIVLEEMLMLWLENQNPALEKFSELFSDGELSRDTAYKNIIHNVESFFRSQPVSGKVGMNLFELLTLPVRKSPHNLQGQLRFIMDTWGFMLRDLVLRVTGSLDFIREENKPVFTGPAPTNVIQYGDEYETEPERFSPDLHWMPSLVLIAKSALVWLDQLSKKYQRKISRFDEIPDEEIFLLAEWGFTGIWLIGVWERSPASRKIKNLCGNPEAESSAYSLFDYQVADELGGDPALDNFRERCFRRGIRLGCDMVPNHTGIDSKWIREHPDWFISLSYSPFPGYTFNYHNLSSDPRYGIFIEDKYYSQQDAAVVFKHEDYWTGDVRYIYHGNDGTSMPWNDTAQLNYLNPDVREAVIQKIVEVVKRFPVVRFDAAMTLAKKHYQRLWFPEPGGGGDIPTRSQFGLSKPDFNQEMPIEFWREVVDRVGREAPDSLLLAEAFWFMEGYFVRTLGMHRVYNSSFMNMLKKEENSKYRQTVIKTLQFNPEVLKRYVNFMNNPDEDTAIAQFGDSDKYFGVCIMMTTMPGLPMFGHGQIEGFHEKYGMEYRRAYYDEQPNHGLIERHGREIFPILRKRHLFAEVENFLFYDFVNSNGTVNDNVFAYSNSVEGVRTLILYHNRFEDTAGWIRLSVPFCREGGDSWQTRSLAEGLHLSANENAYLIFRDDIKGVQYIRSSREVVGKGLYFHLGAFKYIVITELYETIDHDGSYQRLCQRLNGLGVESIEHERKLMELKPFLLALNDVISQETLGEFIAALEAPENQAPSTQLSKSALNDFEHFYQLVPNSKNDTAFLENFLYRKNILNKIYSAKYLAGQKGLERGVKPFIKKMVSGANWSLIFCWAVMYDIALSERRQFASEPVWVNDYLIDSRIVWLLQSSGLSKRLANEQTELLKILLGATGHRIVEKSQTTEKILQNLFESPMIQTFTKVNEYDGTIWFDREPFHQMIIQLFFVWLTEILIEDDGAGKSYCTVDSAKKINSLCGMVQAWLKAEDRCDYKLKKLLEADAPVAL